MRFKDRPKETNSKTDHSLKRQIFLWGNLDQKIDLKDF